MVYLVLVPSGRLEATERCKRRERESEREREGFLLSQSSCDEDRALPSHDLTIFIGDANKVGLTQQVCSCYS